MLNKQKYWLNLLSFRPSQPHNEQWTMNWGSLIRLKSSIYFSGCHSLAKEVRKISEESAEKEYILTKLANNKVVQLEYPRKTYENYLND